MPLKTQKDGPDSPNNIHTADDIQSKNLLNNTGKIRELNQQVASLQNVIIQVNILSRLVGGSQNKAKKVFFFTILFKCRLGLVVTPGTISFWVKSPVAQILIFSISGFIFGFYFKTVINKNNSCEFFPKTKISVSLSPLMKHVVTGLCVSSFLGNNSGNVFVSKT